jgi:hypothetical protein
VERAVVKEVAATVEEAGGDREKLLAREQRVQDRTAESEGRAQ